AGAGTTLSRIGATPRRRHRPRPGRPARPAAAGRARAHRAGGPGPGRRDPCHRADRRSPPREL
ncbi:MAG: hypothetical protein AVDCRST_MAG18-5128, partial [uncultured Thermomicrobiales bacterium]